jgi:hypothetical protein
MMPQISLLLLTALLWSTRLLLLPPTRSFLVLDAKGGEREYVDRGSFVRRFLILMCAWYFHASSCIVMYFFVLLALCDYVLASYFSDMLVILSLLYHVT